MSASATVAREPKATSSWRMRRSPSKHCRGAAVDGEVVVVGVVVVDVAVSLTL